MAVPYRPIRDSRTVIAAQMEMPMSASAEGANWMLTAAEKSAKSADGGQGVRFSRAWKRGRASKTVCGLHMMMSQCGSSSWPRIVVIVETGTVRFRADRSRSVVVKSQVASVRWNMPEREGLEAWRGMVPQPEE
jgi:hypothetical protein